MTGKERLAAKINGKVTDKICWAAILEDSSRINLPEVLRQCSIIDLYKFIGCDVIQFGNRGLRDQEKVTYPYFYIFDDMAEHMEILPDGSVKETRKTKKGELTSILKNSQPVKYAVETLDDLFLLLDIWSNTDVAEVENYGPDNYRIAGEIGDSGIFVPTHDPSAVQRLIEYDMGAVNFTYFLYNYPNEMERLIAEMHRCKYKEYEYTARNMPFDIIIPNENTSAMMIRPEVYRAYCLNHMRDFTDIMHKYNKKSIIRMSGPISNLLNEISEIGLDGIYSFSESPAQDCLFEKALKFLGEDLIIFGRLNSTISQSETFSSEDIVNELDRLYNQNIFDSRFILLAISDGLPVDLRKLNVMREWVESKN
jgi:Uroporphyrinogen decarboxylase (URO-D).